MSSNKLKLQAFRANDLSNDTGKQFELGRSWCDFFEIDDHVGEITFHLYFKPLSKAHENLANRQIDLQLSALTARNDRKAYANGARSGHSAIKEFFLDDLRLTAVNNSSDYFAIYKASEFSYFLYYVPKLLHDNFIKFFESISPTVTINRADERKSSPCNCLQQIFYGAPGTGKSHSIKDDAAVKEAEKKNLVFRTTFHPDSDYSTFVGCYKPTKAKSKRLQRMNLSLEDLAKELGSYYTNEEFGKIGGIQKFCFEYYPYIDGEYMSVNITKLLELAGVPKDYNVEINKYIKFCHLLPKQDPDKITYNFIPQAFTNAYVKAWNTDENVYLIIEEINRGNCAQIFGDLFQLLDRKNGVSEYPVEADTDLQNYLCKALTDTKRTDIPDDVKSGKKLMLPTNLYIWATMNTSDQSLFPIDSAFKRRWEWKYIKIKEGKDENGNKFDWKVDVKMDESDTLLPWWDFIKKINEIIASMTSSADKQLGYFFCCAKDGVIDEETFVSKVIFYLWNDVFKDYGFEDASLFRYTAKNEDGKDIEKDLTFPDFYDEEGEKVNTERLTDFVKKVMSWKKTNAEQD